MKIQKYDFEIKRNGEYEVKEKITSKYAVSDFLKNYLREKIPLESVVIIALDEGSNIIGFQAVEGAVNQCSVYPQNVFRFLLIAGASSFVIAHNHPGGTTTPSASDWTATHTLKRVGKDLEIVLHDHLIITETEIVSMRENSRWNAQ